jgi:hypothetical protein
VQTRSKGTNSILVREFPSDLTSIRSRFFESEEQHRACNEGTFADEDPPRGVPVPQSCSGALLCLLAALNAGGRCCDVVLLLDVPLDLERARSSGWIETAVCSEKFISYMQGDGRWSREGWDVTTLARTWPKSFP